jgi:hypothetical protein
MLDGSVRGRLALFTIQHPIIQDLGPCFASSKPELKVAFN